MYVTLSFVDYSVAMVTDVCRVVTIRHYVITTSVYTTTARERERERGREVIHFTLYNVWCTVLSIYCAVQCIVYMVSCTINTSYVFNIYARLRYSVIELCTVYDV